MASRMRAARDARIPVSRGRQRRDRWADAAARPRLSGHPGCHRGQLVRARVQVAQLVETPGYGRLGSKDATRVACRRRGFSRHARWCRRLRDERLLSSAHRGIAERRGRHHVRRSSLRCDFFHDRHPARSVRDCFADSDAVVVVGHRADGRCRDPGDRRPCLAYVRRARGKASFWRQRLRDRCSDFANSSCG